MKTLWGVNRNFVLMVVVKVQGLQDYLTKYLYLHMYLPNRWKTEPWITFITLADLAEFIFLRIFEKGYIIFVYQNYSYITYNN